MLMVYIIVFKGKEAIIDLLTAKVSFRKMKQAYLGL